MTCRQETCEGVVTISVAICEAPYANMSLADAPGSWGSGRLVKGACIVRKCSWQECLNTLSDLLRPMCNTIALSPERGHHEG
jgi:hypothetical protein